MNSILNRAKIGVAPGLRPPAAVEITPEGIFAAAVPEFGQAPVYAFEPLAKGAMVPCLTEVNIHAPEAVAAAIHSALEKVSSRARAVTLILPDASVRVFLLEFDSLPKPIDEVYSVLRFRLRKVVPFDVEQAALTYQVLSQNQEECKVLVAVMRRSVLAEYEAATRSAGYEPGAVLSSGLAALEAADPGDALLSANLAADTLTTFITDGQELLLYRTIDLPAQADLHADEVQRGVAVAAAYFEDKLGRRPQKLHYGGISTVREFEEVINDPMLTVVELGSRPEIVTSTPNTAEDLPVAIAPRVPALLKRNTAALTGALAGAR